MAKRRPLQSEIVEAFRRVLAEAFPGNAALIRVVDEWIALVPVTGRERCAMCHRTLKPGPMVQRVFGEVGIACFSSYDYTRGWGDAICVPCIEASAEALIGPVEQAPAWSMVLAELARAKELLDPEIAAAAWKLLDRRPVTSGGGPCIVCRKKSKGPLARAGHKRLCARCAKTGREAVRKGAVVTVARPAPPPPLPLRCPKCRSLEAAELGSAWSFTGEGYAEFKCNACGFQETVDGYDLDTWYRPEPGR